MSAVDSLRALNPSTLLRLEQEFRSLCGGFNYISINMHDSVSTGVFFAVHMTTTDERLVIENDVTIIGAVQKCAMHFLAQEEQDD